MVLLLHHRHIPHPLLVDLGTALLQLQVHPRIQKIIQHIQILEMEIRG
mgnify:CR=1 FL=1